MMSADASMMAPPPPMACKPAPAPSAPRKSKKMFGLFGGKDDEAVYEEPAPSVTDADRKSLQKAVTALRKALEAARAELEKGKVPSAGAIDKARKALLQELAGSPLGTTLGALQRLLRSGLLELVAALGAKGARAAELLAALDRCTGDLESSVRDAASSSPKFWEKMI